jgi:hypothetical protein
MFLLPGGSTVEAAVVAITHMATAADTATKTTYTFTSQTIGADTASHKVVVAAHWAGGATYVSSTVAGVSTTAVADANASGHSGNTRCQLVYADGITATSGTVTIVITGAADRLGIAIFDVRNAALGNAFATSADNDESDPLTGSLNVEAGGACLGCTAMAKTGAPNVVWTNLDEDYDEAVEGSDFWASGASKDFAVAQTPLSVTANPDSFIEGCLVCASFSPA